MATRDAVKIVRSGVLIGIGMAGTLDEVVFHQLLDWHHFLDRADPAGGVSPAARQLGLLSDGFFHAFSTVLLGMGLTSLLVSGAAALRGQGRRVAGAVMAGAGGFNLYDGVVQHKLAGLHQVRRGVDNLLPYDLAWFAVALALLVAGVVLVRQPARSPARTG